MDIIQVLAQEFNLKESQVKNTVDLIDEGNTIPFIARYRKEVTGSLDDEILRKFEERLNYLRNIEKRREEVIELIRAQEKLTPEIEEAINNAVTITEIDDIYRPFRPHRKTRDLNHLLCLFLSREKSMSLPLMKLRTHILMPKRALKIENRRMPALAILSRKAFPTMLNIEKKYAVLPISSAL